MCYVAHKHKLLHLPFIGSGIVEWQTKFWAVCLVKHIYFRTLKCFCKYNSSISCIICKVDELQNLWFYKWRLFSFGKHLLVNLEFYIEVDQPAVWFQSDARERLLKNTNAANPGEGCTPYGTGLCCTISLIYLYSMYSVWVILRRLNCTQLGTGLLRWAASPY